MLSNPKIRYGSVFQTFGGYAPQQSRKPLLAEVGGTSPPKNFFHSLRRGALCKLGNGDL